MDSTRGVTYDVGSRICRFLSIMKQTDVALMLHIVLILGLAFAAASEPGGGADGRYAYHQISSRAQFFTTTATADNKEAGRSPTSCQEGKFLAIKPST